MKVITILFFAFFLSVWQSGCAQKEGLFAPDTFENRALAKTRKGEIYNSLEIKASIVATWLNPLLSEFKNEKNACFLVTVFIDDDFEDPKKQGLNNPDYVLTLEGKEPVSVKPLSEDDPLVKMAPLKMMWGHNYLACFPDPGSKTMRMRFTSRRYGVSVLTFSKE